MPAHVASRIWSQASRLSETELKMGGHFKPEPSKMIIAEQPCNYAKKQGVICGGQGRC